MPTALCEAHERIHLDVEHMQHNPGKRTVVKLMLNSMWGKFGQWANKAQLCELTRAQDMHTFLGSGKYDGYVSHLETNRLQVHFKSPNRKLFAVCFSTCWACLCTKLWRLWKNMSSTSIWTRIFYKDQNLPLLEFGNSLGDFKDELTPGKSIVRRPKNLWVPRRGVDFIPRYHNISYKYFLQY